MILINKEQVYINLETKFSVDLNTHVYVRDVGEVYCNDNLIRSKVENIRIYNGSKKEAYDYISGTEITTKVLENIDSIDLNIIGGPDVLLEIKGKEDSKRIFNMCKVGFVMIVLFFGAAVAVVNFYEDVNMSKSMERIYYIVTGVKKNDPLILTIPLSIGTGIGMFSFFSRIFSFSKRRRQEPGPMELELYLYDKDLEENILNELKDKSRLQ